MRHSVEGLRIAAGDPVSALGPRPWVLALGCSFTYGDACAAEDTFAYRVAKSLGGSALNAGCNGYGLAQMLVRAQSLVPRYHPDYVLVQSSPWLTSRGTSGFARSTFGEVPVPYLFLANGGHLRLHAPAFRAAVFDLPLQDYTDSASESGSFPSMLFRVGFPLFARDDLHMAVYDVERGLGQLPEPGGDATAINNAAYHEIAALCRESGAVMVSVQLRHHLETFPAEAHLPKTVLVAHAQEVLDALVPDPSDDAYYKRFGHWGGDPPVLVDTHPNPDAHRIIADTILTAIATRPH
jgi:hypothetical protein